MGVSLPGNGPGAAPLGPVLLPRQQHIPQTVGQVLPLFNNRAPCRPHHRMLRKGQHIPERFQIFLVQQRVADLLHIVGRGRPLGVDVEHDEAVKPVPQGNALHGFKGIVQRVGSGRGGVDANADQRLFPPRPQYVTVFRVKIGSVDPLFDIVFVAGGVGGFQRLPEGDQLQLLCRSAGNVRHQLSSTGGNHRLLLGSWKSQLSGSRPV